MGLFERFLFAGGESSNTDFNERPLDLRNCRRFTPFFRPFSSGEGRGFARFLVVALCGESAVSLREDRESDDSLREDRDGPIFYVRIGN